jgi:thymidylate kinase
LSQCIRICFLGIDGSGKSTLSRYLCDELRRRGYPVSYTWWLEGEHSAFRTLLRWVGKGHSAQLRHPETRATRTDRTSNFTVRVFEAAYPSLVLLDYLRFGIVKAWLPALLGADRVIIFDRFIYDTVSALSHDFKFATSRQERLLLLYKRLLPNPNIIFIVDVPPKVAQQRKSDEIPSVAAAQKMHDRYRELYAQIERSVPSPIVHCDNTGDLDSVKAEVLQHTLDVLQGASYER